MPVLSARVLSKNVVSFVLCELLLVVLLHHLLPLLPRLQRPLLDFALEKVVWEAETVVRC